MVFDTTSQLINQPLALLGGPPVIETSNDHLFHWPIISDRAERAVLDMLRNGQMSAWNVTQEFERDFATYQGTQFALGFPNGTMSLLAAMYGIGIGQGDEIIAPSLTYWASVMPIFSLRGNVVFADNNPTTLCLSPTDIERHITSRTKAILVVHYGGHPCDMDPILEIASQHRLKVIEDVSHAHGGLYKGRIVGSLGDVGCFSLNSIKPLGVGEAGLICTNDREILERAIAFSDYGRHDELLTDPQLRKISGVSLGGVKGRMNQLCAALGRIQLSDYPARMAEIQGALHRLCDLLEGCPGLRAHRTPKGSDSTMGGWYNPLGFYNSRELSGLPVERFTTAVRAEGVKLMGGCNPPLHLHPAFNTADIYNDGIPTRLAHSDRDLRQPPGSLPHAENSPGRTFCIPWFKRDDPAEIEHHAAAYWKVALQANTLLNG